MVKGISPFVAVILLIAFTIAIGGILSLWFYSLKNFSRITTTKENINETHYKTWKVAPICEFNYNGEGKCWCPPNSITKMVEKKGCKFVEENKTTISTDWINNCCHWFKVRDEFWTICFNSTFSNISDLIITGNIIDWEGMKFNITINNDYAMTAENVSINLTKCRETPMYRIDKVCYEIECWKE